MKKGYVGEQLAFDLDDRVITTTVVKALKNDQDKIDLSLIPYCAQIAEAKALMVGAKKYARYNYTKGHEASQLVSAAQRHLLAWFSGEESDPIDGQPHLGSVKACMSMLIHQMELGTLIDNRFKPRTKDTEDGFPASE